MRQFYLTVFSLLVLNAFGQAPKMSVNTTGINVTAAVGATATQTFTITNSGNRDMTWQFRPEGQPVAFTKHSFADFTQTANQDRVTDNVWITRADTRGLFNIAEETAYSNYYSPAGTEWSYGNSRELSPGDYEV